MKHKIITLLTVLTLLAGWNSCQKVEDMTPPVSREGINSITASFPNDDLTENSFTSEIDHENGLITIVFPYNYPRLSDNVLTMDKLKRVRVSANLDDNVTITPAILYMDLTVENHITVTDQSKKQRNYKVIGEIRKSSEAKITDFELKDLGIAGVIDEDTKTISLVFGGDIGAVTADVKVSHGATMSPNPTQEALNYDSDVQITVTAQDGSTTVTYTVKKDTPSKVELGMRPGSAKILWVKKLNSELGIVPLNITGGIAALKDYLVINTRGENSIYLDRKTGEKVGTVNLGDKVGNLTNFYNTADDNDNILLCNLAPNDGSFKVWKIKGVTGTPEPFIEWDGGLAVGRKLSVKGSIDSDAIITAAILGAGNQFARWQVKDGILLSQTPEIVTINGIEEPWNNNCDVVATNPSDKEGDYFVSFYALPRKFTWVDGRTNNLKALGAEISPNWIPNAADYVVFNNNPYAVHNTINSFTWGADDKVYLYDVSTTGGLAAPIWSAEPGKYGGKDHAGQNANGTGDVALKVSENGYFMYLYFMFTNGCVVCVQFDCIDM